ncbi:MAG: hypothetical protein AAGJ37_03305 [Pseudomonadota bacterium]
MADKRLDEAVKGITKKKSPERDLWQGIELAIASEQTEPVRRRHIMPLYAIAASVMLVIVIGIGNYDSGEMSQTQIIAEQMSTDYLAKREALLVAYGNTAVTVDDLEIQLANLDDAASAIKKAISEDANNPVLLQMLKRVYAQQIELIEKVHAPKWQQL